MTRIQGGYGRLLIGGEECESQHGERFDVLTPATGAWMGSAARATRADVARAVACSSAAQAAWAASPPDARERILLAAADRVEGRAAELVELLIDESGSTITKARYEVAKAVQLLRTAAGETRRLYGDTFPNDRPQRLSLTLREPLGVVAVISPFNAPLALFAKMTVFALAAGNAVVAKPSEETPLIALAFTKLLWEAGLPAGVLNVITGFGETCGEPLVSHPGVAGIAFTGSTRVGRAIGSIAADGVKRVQLELGGKNPLIVLRDFEVGRAAELAAVGAFAHAGQICMAGSRVLVEEPLLEPFLDAFRHKCEALHLGDLRDARTAYGPLINACALARVDAHVREALDGGGTLVTGGRVHQGWVYQPTVVLQPPTGRGMWREETFGPVVSVVPVRDLQEALATAHDTEFGLSAGVLTHDLRRGLSLARQLRAGSVHVGTHSFQSDALAPIGGFGMSGVGRSGGKYSIEAFTELKWISVELGTLRSLSEGAIEGAGDMAIITKGYVETSRGQVHYRRAGQRSGRLPIVLLHQTASSSAMFEALMEQLAPDHYLFAPDTPGFGESFRPTESASIPLYAIALREACARAGIDRCYLFGHHTGASIAVEMVAREPSFASRLALSGPCILSAEAARNLTEKTHSLQLCEDGSHLNAVWQRIQAKDPDAPLWLKHREAVLTLLAGPRWSEGYHAVFAHQAAFERQLRSLTLATLVFAGEKDTVYDLLEPSFAVLQNGRKAVIPGQTTYSCDRAPEEVATLLRDFFSVV